MKTFKELGVSEQMLKLIEKEKFENPTEIQEKVLPLVLSGKDVIAGASTGSGKTLAFALGVVKNTERGRGVQALILTPTRELCNQVAAVHRKFSFYKGLNVVEVFGGVSIINQIRDLKRADIVVGTPGRMLDHMRRGTIDLRNVRTLVLDEADRMFDMGFIKDVEEILKHCSKQRQTMLFSATINEDVNRVAKRHMNEPVKVSAVAYVDPTKLKQIYYEVRDEEKFSLLVHLIKKEKESVVMVFCNSKRMVDIVEENLKMNGLEAHSLHGGLSQNRRSDVLRSFHQKRVHILVCTDVAARGLDIKGVTHVYNFDIPKDSKEYVHRIGRTARAGKDGMAINILSRADHDNFRRVMKMYRANVEKREVPEMQMLGFVRKTRKRPEQSFGSRQRRPSDRKEGERGPFRGGGHSRKTPFYSRRSS